MNPFQDIFPATVLITGPDFEVPIEELRSSPPTPGGAPVNTARVIVARGRVIIARDTATGPMVVFAEDIDPASHWKSPQPLSQDSFVTTVTGKRVVFRKDSGCGCGSRLKSWSPYGSAGMSSVQDPTS